MKDEMAGKTGLQQDKYDNLLLSIVQSTDNKVGRLTTEVAKQGMELKNNTEETRLLKSEVRETNGNVKELQSKVVDINKVVFPEKPVNQVSDLPPAWLKDPAILSLLKPLLWIILGLVAAYLGYKGIKLPGA